MPTACGSASRPGRHRQRLGGHAAVGPGGVGGQDQGGDLPRRRARRLDRHRGVAPDRRRRGRTAHPAGHAARPALGIRGQRRIQRTVIGRLVADDVHDRGGSAARVVQVGERVRESRPAMEQGGRRLARHPRIAVGRAGHHALEQAQHAAHAGDAVERGDEMHLRRAGIGEARVDAAGEQGGDEGFGAVHAQCSRLKGRSDRVGEAAGGGNRACAEVGGGPCGAVLFSPSPCGRGLGGGGQRQDASCRWPPPPNPLPQGEGEKRLAYRTFQICRNSGMTQRNG